MGRISKKIIASMMGVALVVSLCPFAANTAFASSTQNIKVVDKYGDTSFTYNKNGFIAKSKGASYGMSSTKTYKYSGAKILSCKSSGEYGGTAKVKYKNGRISKVTYKWKGVPAITDTYKYKKGEIVQVSRKNAGNSLVKYAYDKKGRISKVTQVFQITKRKTEKDVTTFKYDSKGNVVREINKGPRWHYDTKYQNEYKDGMLVKHEMKGGAGLPGDITYKTVSIPKKYVAKVKAQQKQIFVSYGKDQDPFFF